jgi:hypothetical protein
MAETQLRRAAAETRLRPGAPRQRLTRQQLTSIVTAMRDLTAVLASADPANKAERAGPCVLDQVAAGSFSDFGAGVLARSIAEQLDAGFGAPRRPGDRGDPARSATSSSETSRAS